MPGVFFFAAPMTESLFLLQSLLSLYLARKKHWIAACLMGALAAFTRSVGLILFVPVLYELICETVLSCKKKRINIRKTIICYLSLVIIPLGFAVYCFINYQITGNPFQFLTYQKEHWSQSIGYFFNTASYQIEYMIGEFHALNWESMMGLWIPGIICFFGALCTLILSVKRICSSYVAYSIVYFVVTMGATWLLSAPRYLLILFPLPATLAALTDKRWIESLLTIILSVINVLYLFMFVNRWQVW